jgi:hypothetical protein
LRKRKIFTKRNFAKFCKNWPIFAWFSHFRENIKSHFRFNPKYRFIIEEIFNYKNRLRSILHSTELIFYLLYNHQFSLLFYCHGVGKIIYGPFLLYCCFNGFYKSRNIGILTLCSAKKTCNSKLCCIVWSFKKKVLSVTPCNVTQCEIQAQNFLVDSTLCVIAQKHLHLRIFFCEFATLI